MSNNESVFLSGLSYDSIMNRLVCSDWEEANELDSARKWNSVADQILGESIATVWLADIGDPVVQDLVRDLQFCMAIAVQRAYDATVRGTYA